MRMLQTKRNGGKKIITRENESCEFLSFPKGRTSKDKGSNICADRNKHVSRKISLWA